MPTHLPSKEKLKKPLHSQRISGILLVSKEFNEFHGKGVSFMELAKITSKGQITLPINIRRALKLNDGDKVAFVEANGQFILANPSMLALRQAQDAFAGFAEENDLQTDEDVVDLVKEIRAERGR